METFSTSLHLPPLASYHQAIPGSATNVVHELLKGCQADGLKYQHLACLLLVGLM